MTERGLMLVAVVQMVRRYADVHMLLGHGAVLGTAAGRFDGMRSGDSGEVSKAVLTDMQGDD